MIAPARSSFAGASRRKKLPWPKDHIFRILSVDGGGIKGIFPAAVLAGLENRYLGGEPIGQFFDLIVGTSTGGIVALGLGKGLTAREMLDLYLLKGNRIFPPGMLYRWWANLRALSLYRYERVALDAALREVLGDHILADSGSRLCIPAFEGYHGEVYIFKTPHHPDYRLDGALPMVEVAQATSAAPTYFQSLDSKGYRFVDGGVWANNPIMIGLVDALCCFDVDPSQIRILSIGCGREASIVSAQQARGGLWSWRTIIKAAMDLQSQNSMGQTRLLIGPQSVCRLEPSVLPPIGLDDWARASAELPPEADRLLQDTGDWISRVLLEQKCSRASFFWPPASGVK